MAIGFNLTFVIQHFLGWPGCRAGVYYSYLPGWGWMNMVSTIGDFLWRAAPIFVWTWLLLFSGKIAGESPGCLDARVGYNFAAAA